MPGNSADTAAIYRASIVSAVKRGSALMADLLRQVRHDWPQGAQASARDAQALQLLAKNETKLVTQFPLMMLELFAQGAMSQAGNAFVTAKLSELGKNDVRVRVEMVRARQCIAAMVGPSLSELDTLIGAAQGLDRVQPERNPLRPGNYVRALFVVVYGLNLPEDLVRLWLQRMPSALGLLLSREYLRVSEQLRARGVQPLLYLTSGRSQFSELQGEERAVPGRGETMESFLAPLGAEALPGIDSSMWDSVRPVSTLLEPEPEPEDSTAAAPFEATRQDGLAVAPSPVERILTVPVEVDEPSRAQEAAPAARDGATESTQGEALLRLGDWVSIASAHGRVRTQLTWLSPRRTLFLFTQADGNTQSMTSRMVTRMLQSGAMQRVQG